MLTLDRFESQFPRASESAFLLGSAESAMLISNSDVSSLMLEAGVNRFDDEKHVRKERQATLIFFPLASLCSRSPELVEQY